MDEEPKKSINIDYYIEMLLKRRWFIIIPFCIFMVIGITLSIKLPRRYTAMTLILVEPQRVPAKFVQAIVDSDIEERVVTLQEQVMSQTNLEGIIDKFNMFSGKQYEKMFLEDKVASLRRRITVKVTKAKRGADAFSISFEDNNPELVMNVVNALATSFIDKNLELRETRVIGTVEFLNGQLEDMRKKLTDVEERLKDYRKKHMGELPEQLSSNEKVLDRLQLRAADRNLALRDAKNRLSELEREEKIKLTVMESQMSAMEQQNMLNIPIIPLNNANGSKQGAIPGQVSAALPKDSEKMVAFNKLKEQYESALLRYTPRHPDVIKLKKMTGDLEAELSKESEIRKAAEQKMAEESKKGEESGKAVSEDIEMPKKLQKNSFNDGISRARAAIKAEIQDKRDKISKEIAAIEEELAKLDQESKLYEQRVDITPKREQDMMSLTRDYSNIQKYYSELLNRKLEADIAMDLEKRAKGEQFRILDKAKKPERPIFPDIRMFFLISIGAGLAVGIGLAFLTDFMDNTLKRAEDVEPLLDIPVLATIPKIYNEEDRGKRRINRIFTIASIMVVCVLVGIFAILALKGVDPTLAFVKKLIGKKI
ncbi:MAG: hypothetical protein HC887_01030 [Desulfobacteraceae bacterium]|nr:hypothetical protein [Desulfobacteraceae bacterium]